MASPPAWLSGFKLPGYTGEGRGKGDGVIVDNATELDPSAKAGPLVTPLPDARTIGDWITAIIPDQAKGLVDYITTAVVGNGDGSTFWSSTKDKTPVENAYSHSTKHGAEFPEYQNSVQYVQAAQDFVNNPPEGTLIKTRSNGDTLYYDPSSDTFAVKTKDGAPKTMFKPDPAQHGYATNLDYFNAQK